MNTVREAAWAVERRGPSAGRWLRGGHPARRHFLAVATRFDTKRRADSCCITFLIVMICHPKSQFADLSCHSVHMLFGKSLFEALAAASPTLLYVL